MWVQSVITAISHVEHEHPGLATKVATFDPDTEWEKEQWEPYNTVAKAIVEPFSFEDCESEDEDWYNEKTEKEGFDMVKGAIADIDNKEAWIKICDIVNIQGY